MHLFWPGWLQKRLISAGFWPIMIVALTRRSGFAIEPALSPVLGRRQVVRLRFLVPPSQVRILAPQPTFSDTSFRVPRASRFSWWGEWHNAIYGCLVYRT